MACRIDRKREMSPISRAHVSAVIRPTQGTVCSRRTLSARNGSRSSERINADSMCRRRRIESWLTRRSGRMLLMASSLASSSETNPSRCPESHHAPPADWVQRPWHVCDERAGEKVREIKMRRMPASVADGNRLFLTTFLRCPDGAMPVIERYRRASIRTERIHCAHLSNCCNVGSSTGQV